MNIIQNNLALLVFLLPLSYVIGSAVTEILFLTSIILFLILNKDRDLYFEPSILFLFIFSLYIFLSSYILITDEYGKDLKLSSYFHFRFVLFSLAIYFLCSFIDRNKKNLFFYLFSFLILILLIDAIFQFFHGKNILGYGIHNSGRISSFFKDELILGSFLVRLMPILIWSFFFFKIDLKKNIFKFIIFLSLYFIVIYISGGRTSFFLFLFLICSLFFLIKDLRLILFSSLLILIIFAFSVKIFELGRVDTSHRMFVKTFQQISNYNVREVYKTKISDNSSKNSINSFNKINFYSNDHEGHIKLALGLFNDQKIFGIGPKGFRHHCRKVNYNPNYGICSTHPHNILIQIISELGIIGFIFYIIALTFILYHLIISKFMKNSDENLFSLYAISLGLIANLFPLIPGGNFFNNWISIILYYNIGVYLFCYKKVF